MGGRPSKPRKQDDTPSYQRNDEDETEEGETREGGEGRSGASGRPSGGPRASQTGGLVREDGEDEQQPWSGRGRPQPAARPKARRRVTVSIQRDDERPHRLYARQRGGFGGGGGSTKGPTGDGDNAANNSDSAAVAAAAGLAASGTPGATSKQDAAAEQQKTGIIIGCVAAGAALLILLAYCMFFKKAAAPPPPPPGQDPASLAEKQAKEQRELITVLAMVMGNKQQPNAAPVNAKNPTIQQPPHHGYEQGPPAYSSMTPPASAYQPDNAPGSARFAPSPSMPPGSARYVSSPTIYQNGLRSDRISPGSQYAGSRVYGNGPPPTQYGGKSYPLDSASYGRPPPTQYAPSQGVRSRWFGGGGHAMRSPETYAGSQAFPAPPASGYAGSEAQGTPASQFVLQSMYDRSDMSASQQHYSGGSGMTRTGRYRGGSY